MKRLVVFGAALAIGVIAPGCSLLLNVDASSQCSTTSDCDASPTHHGRVCDLGFCVVPASTGCVSTSACTEANNGRASICPKPGDACTPWQTTLCPYMSGDAWSDPNAIIVGSMLPLTAKQFDGSHIGRPYADRVRHAIDLGLDEVTAAQPGGVFFPNTPRRPLSVLQCDTSYDAETAREVFTHLTEVVGVQAIIVGSDEDLASIAPLAKTKHVAIACSDCLGPLPPDPVAWRIVPALALEARMAAWRVARLEASIRMASPAQKSIKVAVLIQPEPAPRAFTKALESSLQLNGGGVDANPSSYREFEQKDPAKTSVDIPASANDIAEFGPDVIVVAMGDDFGRKYLSQIEDKWLGLTKPYYVITDLDYELTSFGDYLTMDKDDVRRRISGTRPGYTKERQDNIDAFAMRYRAANNVLSPDGCQSGYDAFYAMFYAIMSTRTQPVFDGPHISNGFLRLRSGRLVDVGPQPIELAAWDLGQGTTIDVRGLWSDLDWSPTTHDFVSDVSMYCFGRDTGGSLTIVPDAGPRLDAITGLVTGEYTCN